MKILKVILMGAVLGAIVVPGVYAADKEVAVKPAAPKPYACHQVEFASISFAYTVREFRQNAGVRKLMDAKTAEIENAFRAHGFTKFEPQNTNFFLINDKNKATMQCTAGPLTFEKDQYQIDVKVNYAASPTDKVIEFVEDMADKGYLLSVSYLNRNECN